MIEKSDFLIIGGGIAGLTFALTVAEHGTVTILIKRDVGSSSTAWAQGGIASVTAPDDSFESHINDTLEAGAGLCKADVVRLVVSEAPDRIRELANWGVRFDTKADQQFDLHREGGHSARRILHAADATGAEVQRALFERASSHPNIALREDHCCIDLITTRKIGVLSNSPNRVLGAYAITASGSIATFTAQTVLVATGGAGKVYLYTTNPDTATGDGIAMCFRAGVPVANLEFYQFHPTCLFHPTVKNFLITEAVRGEGGRLLRKDGMAFMKRYDPRGELAPRDIVARAIDQELKESGDDYVLLDISHRQPDFIRAHFPMIFERCGELGIDITREPIPVVPAAHYCCGGVVSGLYGETAVEGLYVAGECAHTGLHGANRLASNSLLEGSVFGRRAALHALEHRSRNQLFFELPTWEFGSARNSDEEVLITQTWSEIRRFMWNFVGIVRSDRRLERALHRSDLVEREIKEYYWNFVPTPELIELRNISLIANLIIHCALLRRESRGLHFNTDVPTTSDLWKSDTIIDPHLFHHFQRQRFQQED